MNAQKPPVSKEQLAQAKVLVVGDVMLDRYWYGAVDRISPEAPVPVVRITREENRLGGCANVAFNALSVGAHASLLSAVGDDEASHLLQDLIAKSGITPYFGRDAQLKTTVKLRVIGRQQQLLRVDFENTPQNEVLSSQTQQFMQLLVAHPVVLFSELLALHLTVLNFSKWWVGGIAKKNSAPKRTTCASNCNLTPCY